MVDFVRLQEDGNGRGTETFYTGPDAHYRWWHKERSFLSIERGPFSPIWDLLLSSDTSIR